MKHPIRLLIVGFPQDFHLGSMLHRAALLLGVESRILDVRSAYHGTWLARQINWRYRGHRPSDIEIFERELLNVCDEYQPDICLVTGILPPRGDTLDKIKSEGVLCFNYLTDDPWNPAHNAPWFMDSLSAYTHIFSPRKANLEDLERLGCTASYLPFGFDPGLHYAEPTSPDVTCDVLFYGGADDDRLPYMTSLIEAGFNVHLYGDYWGRYSGTRKHNKGMADLKTLRSVVPRAKITLCLVRRANRDGHVMRTFEVPAMRGCLLAEDTEEHRLILGAEGTSALFFNSTAEMVQKAKGLLADDTLRLQLINNAHQRVANQQNTYANRVNTIIESNHPTPVKRVL